MSAKPSTKLVCVIGLVLSLLPLQVLAQTADEYLKAAQNELSEDRNESALENIKKAIELNPRELEYQYVFALILIKQEKLETSAEILNALVSLFSFEFGKAYFDLAGIYTKQKKYDKAIATLTKAESVDRERALLERGLLYMETGKIGNAIREFLLVKDSSRFKQEVCYNLARAYQHKMDYKQALVHAQQAIDAAPETGVAKNAEVLFTAISNEMKINRHLRLYATSTNQYDDNVVLLPLEQAGFQDVGITPSNQADFATILTFRGEYKPILKKKWEMAFESTYLQYLYAKLNTNNLIAIMPSARLSFSFFPLYFRFFYQYGYFLVNKSAYANVHLLSFASSLVEGRHGRMELMLEMLKRRYLDEFTPDADHYMIGLRQFFIFPKVGEVQVGYKYEIENNLEDKGDFTGHEFILGWGSPFILKTYLNINYSFKIRDFEWTEAISPSQQRKDQEHLVSAILSKRIGRHFELTLFYNRSLNDSNIANSILDISDFDPYHWKKNVVSLSLSLFF